MSTLKSIHYNPYERLPLSSPDQKRNDGVPRTVAISRARLAAPIVPAPERTAVTLASPDPKALSLFQKHCIPPSGSNHDRLHPTPSDPSVHYVEEGLWETRITFKKDPSSSVFLKRMEGARHRLEGKTFESFDSLCEHEVRRRFASRENPLTEKELKKYKRQVAFSACNRDDLVCRPLITDPELRSALQVANDDVLETEHHFAKNSPMNGLSFKNEEGQVEILDQAIACSNDRKCPNTGNLRKVSKKDGTSIAYAGRVDSLEKVEEQASFIFLEELKSKRKGITEVRHPDGSVSYEMDYVLSSALSTPFFMTRKIPKIIPFPERGYTESQIKALAALKEKGWIEVKDPNNGRTYKVKFNPVMFSGDLNVFLSLEKFLPPYLTGEARAKEISKQGFLELEQIAQKKISKLQAELQNATHPSVKETLVNKLRLIESYLDVLRRELESPTLLPEEEFLYRDHLCKLLDLPIVYHCKSSTDRTSILIALSSSFQQWIDLNLPLPSPLHDLLKDPRFKELFMANWTVGHQITRYARGSEGIVNGERLNNKNLGLSIGRGFAQNPVMQRLVPERYLEKYPLWKKIGGSFLFFLVTLVVQTITFLLAIFGIIGYLITGCKHPTLADPFLYFIKGKPVISFFKIPSAFPDKVLNESSPQVGGRLWIAGGSHGSSEEDEEHD
jgi:hypothetical protein